MRLQYVNGVDNFYRCHGDDYSNPHSKIVSAIVKEIITDVDGSHVLDLACGSGEVTLALRALDIRAEGIDPYTNRLYERRTGNKALPLRFEEIASGALAGRSYSTIICSFALHLCPDSWLPPLLYRLAEISPNLIVITPHKRPEIKWAWSLKKEVLLERVRARVYEKLT